MSWQLCIVRSIIMGGVVEWWTKNGIQIMVLLSLLFQLLLFVIPISRRHRLLEKRRLLARRRHRLQENRRLLARLLEK
jgi:hypothetical protein